MPLAPGSLLHDYMVDNMFHIYLYSAHDHESFPSEIFHYVFSVNAMYFREGTQQIFQLVFLANACQREQNKRDSILFLSN